MAKTPHIYNFSTKLFEFSLHDANKFFNENKNNVNKKMQIGFNEFLKCLDLYLELLENPIINKSRIKIYGSVISNNGTIIRAINSYHGKAWFSDVAISMNSEESDDYLSDQGVCYGQVKK
jgi:hypothetical protein